MNLPQIILKLEITPGHLDKIEIIQKYKKVLMMPLYYAYSPFMRYHIRRIPEDLRGEGTTTITNNFYELLSYIATRTLTGHHAKKSLFNHIKSLTPEYAEVAKRIVKKNLDIGVNTGLINKAFDGELIEDHRVMLAKKYTAERPVEFPCIVSPKIDGVRAVFRKNKFYTRNGHEITGLDHIVTTILFRGVKLPLDGELYIPGVSFEVLSGVIRSNKKVKARVVYAVFDVIHPTWRQTERLAYLEENTPKTGMGFDVEHIPYQFAMNIDQVSQAYRIYRKQGYEGLMIKSPNALYQQRRSWDWQKMKPLHNAEYKIVDVFEGEGKYVGQLGGFIIMVGGQEVRVGSGFTDAERIKIWDRTDDYIGRWATIESMEKTAAGKLRHPIYKGVRWDI